MSAITIQLENLLFRLLRIFRRSFFVKMLNLGVTTHIFLDYFIDFEKLEVVKGIFGKDTKKILSNLKVDLTWLGGYMYVDETNGHLVVSSRYLSRGNRIDIYLDLVHELYHVKQFLEGRKLFDDRFNYVDRPTEIEAYTYTIKEARRLGLSDKRIIRYLETEWITSSDLRRLAKTLDVKF